MKEARLEFRASQDERKKIEEIANSYNLTISDYIRRKLLDDNDDIIDYEDIYLSPHEAKHNVFSVTALYKIIYMINELFRKQGLEEKALIDIEIEALEYARNSRKRFGYNIIEANKT